MGVPGIAIVVRLVRASVLDVLGQEYIRTARAKGLSRNYGAVSPYSPQRPHPGSDLFRFHPGWFGWRHLYRGNLFRNPRRRSPVPIESVIGSRDYPVIMAFAIISTTLFVVANLVVDLMYPWLDPRIRLGAGHVA